MTIVSRVRAAEAHVTLLEHRFRQKIKASAARPEAPSSVRFACDDPRVMSAGLFSAKVDSIGRRASKANLGQGIQLLFPADFLFNHVSLLLLCDRQVDQPQFVMHVQGSEVDTTVHPCAEPDSDLLAMSAKFTLGEGRKIAVWLRAEGPDMHQTELHYYGAELANR